MADYPAGWNDPPALSYSQSSSSGKRNLLNKRVPFPLNSSTVSPQLDRKEPNDLSNADIIQSSVSNNIKNDDSNKEFLEESVNLSDEEILHFVNNVFEQLLTENSGTYEKKRIEEINQRLKIMKESWCLKISLPVKQKMYVLAKELSKGDAEAAMKIQCALMVDHLREVKQWMVGVKHIIEMERQKQSS